MMPTAFVALVKKDLLLFFKDRRSVIMSFAAPIAIASFFGLVLGGATEKSDDRQRVGVWFVDDDNSPLSRRLGESLRAEKALAVRTGTVDGARADVRAGKAAVAVIVPGGLGNGAAQAMFGAGAKPKVQLLFDPSRMSEHEMVKGMLTGKLMQLAGQEVFGGGEGSRAAVNRSLAEVRGAKGMPKGERQALIGLLESVEKWNASGAGPAGGGGARPGLSPPYELAEEAVTARPGAVYNSFAQAFTGMGVQFILFMGIEAGVSLLIMRQRGLWQRLRAAPVSRSLLLSSRAVSAAISALAILAALFTFARIVFGVRVEGSFPGFLLVCLSFALMTAAFGLLVAAFGKTPEATRPLAILVTLILVMLGGSWVPSFLFPAWLDTVTKAVPTRWAVDGLNGMTWRGLGLDYALTCSGMLLIFTGIFAAIAVRKFRWDAHRG